jgi:hypothetical protein
MMETIVLKTDIPGLGKAGDVIEVDVDRAKRLVELEGLANYKKRSKKQ